MSAQTPKAEPSTPTKPTRELGAVDEFVIGCLSGISGAFCAWFQLSGFAFLFYVICVPCLILELIESYILFRATVLSKNEAAYAVTRAKTLARKRLARQLFGQGVIMANAGIEFSQQPFGDIALGQRVALYALAWLGWIMFCLTLNNVPQAQPESVSQEYRKQRLALRNDKNLLRRSRSGSSFSSSSSSSSRRSSRRRSSHSSTTRVPADIP